MDFGNYIKIHMMKNNNDILKYNLAQNIINVHQLNQIYFNLIH